MLVQSHSIFFLFSLTRLERLCTRHTAQLEPLSRTWFTGLRSAPLTSSQVSIHFFSSPQRLCNTKLQNHSAVLVKHTLQKDWVPSSGSLKCSMSAWMELAISSSSTWLALMSLKCDFLYSTSYERIAANSDCSGWKFAFSFQSAFRLFGQNA